MNHKWISTDENHQQCLGCGVVEPAMWGDNQQTCLPGGCPTHEVARPHHFDLDIPWTGHYVTMPGDVGTSTAQDQPILTVFGGFTIRCVFCDYRIDQNTAPSDVDWHCVDEEGSL